MATHDVKTSDNKPTHQVSAETAEALSLLREDFERYISPPSKAHISLYNAKENGNPISYLIKNYGNKEDLLSEGYHIALLKKENHPLYSAIWYEAKKLGHNVTDYIPAKNELIEKRQDVVRFLIGENKSPKEIFSYLEALASQGRKFYR